MRYALLLLLVPSVAFANCMAWFVCPYTTDPSEPYMRRLPLSSVRTNWEAIEVAGNQALVCMPRLLPLERVGCTALNRSQVRELLQPPDVPYFDGGEIKFYDGVEGRQKRTRAFDEETIKGRITDDAIADEILRDRNPRR